MTTDLDRRRLAAVAELERFEADERKRLAYADRAPTLEQTEDEPIGAVEAVEILERLSAYSIDRRLADGTGRHSRDRLREFAADMPPLPTSLLAVGESPSVVANVQFTSVPQLCAAYEYALETMRSLYLLLDLKQHAWQPEQEVMREARQLLLAAGKDVE